MDDRLLKEHSRAADFVVNLKQCLSQLVLSPPRLVASHAAKSCDNYKEKLEAVPALQPHW